MRKILLSISFLISCFVSFGSTPAAKSTLYNYMHGIYFTAYYIAPSTASPAGNDSNPGTITQPKLSLGLVDTYAVAGDVVYVRGGVYNEGGGASTDVQIRLSNMNGGGSPSDSILILAYQNEVPIFNFATVLHTGGDVYGLYVENCTYLRIEGLVFQGLAQNPSGNVVRGVILDNSDHVLFKGNTIRQMGGEGILLYFSDDNNISNCDVSYCSDPYSSGDPYGGANGIASNGINNTSNRNRYEYNRTWFISDDGFDFFDKGGSDTLVGNWSFNNGYIGSFTQVGDGSGFKMGPYTTGGTSSVVRYLYQNLAVGNYAVGFDQNYNASKQYAARLVNNTAYNNGSYNYYFGGGTSANVLINNVAYLASNAPTANGSSTQTTNSWQLFTVDGSYFASLDTSQLTTARNADRTLPTITGFHIAGGSPFIGSGTNSGFGTDMGAFPYVSSGPTNTRWRIRTRLIISN